MDLFKLENTSVSGNPVVLENCGKASLQGLTVYGKSTQVTTTGAQLFVSKKSQESIVGMTLTQKDDGGWHLEGTCTADNSRNIRLLEPTEYFTLPSGDYTLSFTGAIPNSVTLNIAKVANVYKQNEQWTRLGSINKNKRNLAISLDGTEEALSMYVIFPNQVALSFDFYVMLNAGDTVLPWEPYTGGKPSPSPDYPQEIVNGTANVNVRGINLYNPTTKWNANGWLGTVSNTQDKVIVTANNGWINASFLSPVKGETVTFSCTYKQTETTSKDTDQAFCIVTTPNEGYPKSDNSIVYKTSSPNTNESTISATFKSDTYIGIYLRVESEGIGLTRTVELTNIQLEYGSEATSYEPYHDPQTLSLTTPNGLPGIPVDSGGNYIDSSVSSGSAQWICDELDFAGGVYRQWIKHVNVIFNKVTSSDTHSGYRHVATNIQNMSKEHTECLCNIAMYSKNAANGTEGVRASGKFNTIVLYYENLTNDNVSADVAYILSDPIETPLTQSQIETYKSLHTYDGTTIIESPDSVGLSAVYGRKIYMANTTLKTRIILNNKTTDEWAQNGSFVGLKGEFLVDTVTRKIKIGDGATAYTDLAYANLTPEEVQELIKNASHSHSNKSILDETTASFTTALLEKLNGILAQETGKAVTMTDELSGYTDCLEYNNGVMQINTEHAKEKAKATAEEKLATIEANAAQERYQYTLNQNKIRLYTEALGDNNSAVIDGVTITRSMLETLKENNSQIVSNAKNYELMASQIRQASRSWIY